MALGEKLARRDIFLQVLERLLVVVGTAAGLDRRRPFGNVLQGLEAFSDERWVGRLLGVVNPFEQRGIELLHHRSPLDLARLNLVEFGFHIGGKVNLEQVNLVVGLQLFLGLEDEFNQLHTKRSRDQRALFLEHIFALVEL